jgi:hypothetical protein
MGRLAKNPSMVSNAQAAASAVPPSGPSGERPSDTGIGAQRYNTTDAAQEYWDGAVWRTLPHTGLVTITKDTFSGNAVLTAFTMSIAVVDETDIIVHVGGVFQNPAVSYTTDGSTTITFTSPPPDTETIVVLHGYNEVA